MSAITVALRRQLMSTLLRSPVVTQLPRNASASAKNGDDAPVKKTRASTKAATKKSTKTAAAAAAPSSSLPTVEATTVYSPDYQAPEYHQHHIYTYYDIENDILSQRQEQPDCDGWHKQQATA